MKSFLNNFFFDWNYFDILIGGKSALDCNSFIPLIGDLDNISKFVKSYGIDLDSSISSAELFGNFQEALQFIRHFFLKEGKNDDGLDMSIPNSILVLTDIRKLFLMASKDPYYEYYAKKNNKKKNDVVDNISKKNEYTLEDKLWAELVLKVMHTILHVDKDLRSRYFKTIQTQILDRFYKHIYRDQDEKLFLGIRPSNGDKGKSVQIELVDFETKSKKSRDSVIIKMLHKVENVAEELFDRIGIRIVTQSKFDTLLVIKYLTQNHIIIPHNIKPSRSINTLFDLEEFKKLYSKLIKSCLKKQISEKIFLEEVEKCIDLCQAKPSRERRNSLSMKKYASIQFTSRQLIVYKNPMFKEVQNLRTIARNLDRENTKTSNIESKNIGKLEDNQEELIKRLACLDISKMFTELKFFYPYEIQIVDKKTHLANTSGEASHEKYKQKQIVAARDRLFQPFVKAGLL